MCDFIIKDEIKNEVVRNKVGMVFFEDSIFEVRLRWFLVMLDENLYALLR